MRDEFAETRVIKVSGHKTTATLSHYDSSTAVDKMKMALSIQHGRKTLDTGRRTDLNEMIHPSDPVPGPSGVQRRSLGNDNSFPRPSSTRRKSDVPRLSAEPKRPRVEKAAVLVDEFEEEDKENVAPTLESSYEPESERHQPVLPSETHPIALPSEILSSQAQFPLAPMQNEANTPRPTEFQGLVALIQNQQYIAAQKDKSSAVLVDKLLDIYAAKK